jgi:hypothetical protein
MKRVAVAAFAALLLVAGCDKGCAARVDEMGNSRTDPNGTGKGSLPLRGVDCPDGLSRCAGQAVQASRLYTYELPCKGTAEQCTCPWDNVAGCERGCVAENVELVMKKDRAALQLCAPGAGDVLTGPPPKDLVFAAMLCDSASYRCSQGVVVKCGEGEPLALAACVRGCADEDTVVGDDEATRDQAFAILCVHAPEANPAPAPTGKKTPAAY